MPQGIDPNDVYHNGAWYTRSGGGGPFALVTDASDLSSKNLTGGGILVDASSPLAYTDTLVLSTGSGVALNMQGAVLDFRALTGTKKAIKLASIGSAFPIAGFDTDANNYFGWRGKLENFAMVGPGAGSTIDGLASDGAGNPGARSQRTLVNGAAITNFRYGIVLSNVSYLENFANVAVFNCNTCFRVESGLDQGENTVVNHAAFFNSDTGVTIATGADNVELVINETSVDYCGRHMKWESGYGDVTFNNPHFETGVAATAAYAGTCPIDLSVGASNVSRVTFNGGYHVLAGGGSVAWPCYFDIGNNIEVQLCGNPRLQTIGGTSYPWGIGKGAAGVDILMNALARCTGNGKLTLKDPIQSLTVANLPSITAPIAQNSLLLDPGFEQIALIDKWKDESAAPGTTMGVIGTGVTDFLTGARSLEIPITGGSGVNRRLVLRVPVDKLKMAGGGMFKAGWWCATKSVLGTVGTGTYNFSWRWASGYYDNTGTWVYNIPTVVGHNLQSDTPATVSTANWQVHRINGATARWDVPAQATHIQLILNLDSINNPGGKLLLDDLYITPW